MKKFKAWDKKEKKYRNDVIVSNNGLPHIIRTSKELSSEINEHYKKLGDDMWGDYYVIDFTDFYAIENIEIRWIS